MKYFQLKLRTRMHANIYHMREPKQARAQDARAKTGAHARCASQGCEHYARTGQFGHARANKLA